MHTESEQTIFANICLPDEMPHNVEFLSGSALFLKVKTILMDRNASFY